MGTNYIAYNSELDLLFGKVLDKVTDAEKEVVENIFNILTGPAPQGTPVKTGWASANWMINIGGPSPGSVPNKGNVPAMKSRSDASLASFLGREDLLSVTRIVIDNRVSYIESLNNGSSDKSPSDFIDMAVQAGRASLLRTRIK